MSLRMGENFRKQLQKRKPLIGTFLTLSSPEVAEILAGVGMDWLLIDMEHAPFSIQDVQQILQAVHGRCPCIVRVPKGNEEWIKRILDTGADGLLLPHVNSAEEARNIVRYCKYPPDGIRSVGLSRAHEYGLSFQEYVDRANQDIAVIIQVEDIAAVKNIDTIVSVQGIDAVFIGPYDLSGSMAKLGRVKDPEVNKEIEKVRLVCQKAGMPLGIFGIDCDAVEPYMDSGFTMIAIGTDTQMLIASARSVLREKGL
jgi:2-keto-3-deoxy-L-rhamnonate aldolase RhmA